MHKPDRAEITAVAVPVFAAEAAVIVALFLGAAITVQGHSLWAVVIGWWL